MLDVEHTINIPNPVVDHDEYIYMQYTGLKDKNGKEIYEGDIVKHKNGRDILRILYSNIVPWFVFVEKDNLEYIPSIEDYDGLEVLGNIFENPE